MNFFLVIPAHNPPQTFATEAEAREALNGFTENSTPAVLLRANTELIHDNAEDIRSLDEYHDRWAQEYPSFGISGPEHFDRHPLTAGK